MGLKKKMIDELHRYVERKLLPCAYKAALKYGADCTDGDFSQAVRDYLRDEGNDLDAIGEKGGEQ